MQQIDDTKPGFVDTPIYVRPYETAAREDYALFRKRGFEHTRVFRVTNLDVSQNGISSK